MSRDSRLKYDSWSSSLTNSIHVGSMSDAVVAVSAPGKVLFAGGYLVLDRHHTGLVFGLNARIHVHVRWSPSPGLEKRRVVVGSPQFGATWAYEFSLKGDCIDVRPE